MRFGFFMMPAHSTRENPTLAYERDLELIEYVEGLGFDEVWVGEHHTGGWETIPAPDIFIAAAASRTKRIRFGTGATTLPNHHPFNVAERMAFLDHLTYGRLMLGCGPGVLPSDVKLYGHKPADIRPMMNESMDIILKLYREDGPVSYEGKYWQIKDMEIQVPSYQKPHLPVYAVSSGSGNSIRIAAERGLPFISELVIRPGSMELSEQWQEYERQSHEAGFQVHRDDWLLANTAIYLADSKEEAMADIRDGAMRELREYSYNPAPKPTPGVFTGPPIDELTLEYIIKERNWIVGDPDYCVSRIKEIQESTGGFGGLLITTVEWTSTQKWHRSLEMFARYVIPQFTGSVRGIERSHQQVMEDRRTGSLPVTGSGAFRYDRERPQG